MKVAIVVSTLRAGGMERVAVNMANHWAARGWEPALLTLSHRGRRIAYPLGEGVAHHDAGQAPRFGGELDPATMRAIGRALDLRDRSNRLLLPHVFTMARLRRAIADLGPEAIIAFGDVTNLRTIVAAEGMRIPVIVSERCDPYRNKVGGWDGLRRALYPRANGVVAQTADAARFFAGYGCQVHVIPNIVIAAPNVVGQAILPAPPPDRQDCLSYTPRRIVTIARLTVEKRINLLIRAFALIAEKHPAWQLEIWGEGSLRPELEAIIASVGGTRVHLRGHTDDVYSVLRTSQIFAMTSLTEGFPNALCEAMASGVPPVVIDCGSGVREIVRDGVDGVLVRGGTPESFAAALDRLISDDAERARLAERAPEVVERFGAERVMPMWEELIGCRS